MILAYKLLTDGFVFSRTVREMYMSLVYPTDIKAEDQLCLKFKLSIDLSRIVSFMTGLLSDELVGKAF